MRRRAGALGILPRLREAIRLGVIPSVDVSGVAPVIVEVIDQLDATRQGEKLSSPKRQALKLVLQSIITPQGGSDDDDQPSISAETRHDLRKALSQATDERSRIALSSAQPNDNRMSEQLQRAIVVAQEKMAATQENPTSGVSAEAEKAVQSLVNTLLDALKVEELQLLRQQFSDSGFETTPQKLHRVLAQAVNEAEKTRRNELYIKPVIDGIKIARATVARMVVPVIMASVVTLAAVTAVSYGTVKFKLRCALSCQ